MQNTDVESRDEPVPDDGTPPALTRIVAATGLGLVAIALIGWVDVLTGRDLGLSLFYLLPVAAAGWRLGRRAAAVLAAAAAVAWFLADAGLRERADWPISVWNGVTRAVIFGSMGLLLARLRRDRAELARLNARLEEAFGREQRLSRTDPLTELPNLRLFLEEFAREAARSRRDGTPLALCYVDLDRFKAVNDRFGHAAGDELLKRTSRVLRTAVRTGDLVARVGGDEFVLLLVGAREEAAGEVARRLIEDLERQEAEYRSGAGFGASVGVAWFPAALDDLEEMLKRADDAVYAAKAAGRGSVALAP